MKKTILKRVLVALMIMAMLLPCIPVVASAATNVTTRTATDADKAWYGDGTASTFTISSVGDLTYFMELGQTGVTFNGKTIYLANDIVWNDGVASADGFTPSATQGNVIYKWTPYSQGLAAWKEFRGTFDGQGHSISGLYIDTTASNAGFIGISRGCTLKNLIFDNAYVKVSGGSSVCRVAIALGGLTSGSSAATTTTIQNVHTNGYVLASDTGYVAQFSQAGSIVGGFAYHTGILNISNCTASGSVEGRQYTGGLVGSVWANLTTTTTKNIIMSDCVNYADVTGHSQVGGLVGNVASGATFTRCASVGAVNNTSGALACGSLISVRAYNSGTAVHSTAISAYANCARIDFEDCYHIQNPNSTQNCPVFVNRNDDLQIGYRIITKYNGATFRDYVVYGGHADTKKDGNDMDAYQLACAIRDQAFDAAGAKTGILQVPAKGTDVVTVEGTQTAKGTDTFAARFVASIDLGDLTTAEIRNVGFQATILKAFAANGASALKTLNSEKVYTSIKSNYGLDTVYASDFDADYISTLTIENIPTDGTQHLLVRSYYTTELGATVYGSFVAFSFVNGNFAGASVVATAETDSAIIVNRAVGYNTDEFDLTTVLPETAIVKSVSSDQGAYDGTVVPLSFGINTFLVNCEDNGKMSNYCFRIARRDQHLVTFNSNGGSYIPARNVSDGDKIAWDDSVKPTRQGCTFQGWYTEDGTQFTMSSTPITDDIVLIAKWTAPTSASAPSYYHQEYTTSSAALNINWKDYGNAFGTRPTQVLCTLTNTATSVSYQVKVTETGASFVNGKPSGAAISRGAGNWTVKITGLAADSAYTLTQDALTSAPYTTLQSGTNVINTYTTNYIPVADDTAALYTANGRFYDMAGNVVVLRGVVTVNVGTQYFAGNTGKASLARLYAEGINCIRITMQIEGANNIGYVKQTDGSLQTAERKAELMEMLATAVNNATELGMYCIVDWGILGINPQDYQTEAIEFFTALAQMYQNNPYVIFEICNEPKVDAGTWHSTVKPYAETVIEAIRDAGSQAVVIVGSNDYSKNIAEHADNTVANGRTDDPIDYPILAHNVAYGYHAYADNHEYENTTNDKYGYGWRVTEAINAGLTLVVTEFSPANSSIDEQSTGGTSASIPEANKYLNVFLENDVNYFLFRYISYFASEQTSAQHMFEKGYNDLLNKGTWTWDHLNEWGKWFMESAIQNQGFIKVADFKNKAVPK